MRELKVWRHTVVVRPTRNGATWVSMLHNYGKSRSPPTLSPNFSICFVSQAFNVAGNQGQTWERIQSSISAFRSTCLARTTVQCLVIMLLTRYLKSQWQYCWDCSVCWGSFLCELCACIPFLWELYLQLSMQQLCEVFQKTLHSVVLSTLTILLRLIMNSVQLPRCEAWTVLNVDHILRYIFRDSS